MRRLETINIRHIICAAVALLLSSMRVELDMEKVREKGANRDRGKRGEKGANRDRGKRED
jgi:hypothetical protein